MSDPGTTDRESPDPDPEAPKPSPPWPEPIDIPGFDPNTPLRREDLYDDDDLPGRPSGE